MASPKKEALAEFHRQSILKASEHLFSVKGFEKTTMDDIAKTAEYSKATLYVYFKSKDEIINYLTLESMKNLYARFHHTLTSQPNFFSCYKSLCYELVHYQETSPLYFEMTLSTINVDIENPEVPSVFKEIFEVGEKINEEIGKLLQDGIHSGYLKEDLDLLPTIFSLWGGITGIIRVSSQKQLYFMKSMSLTKAEFLDYSFKMFLQSILKEGVSNAY